jgi:hypothetical protein
LDWGVGETATEAGGVSESLDTSLSLDLSASLDEGYDVTTAAIDVFDGEALPGVDGGRTPDRPSDPVADRVSADRQDVAGSDVRPADANDARRADAANAPTDTRDAAAPDTRDGPSPAVDDTRDAPEGDDATDAADTPDEPGDAPQLQPEVKADSAGTDLACLNCVDAQDAAGPPDATVDTSDERLDAYEYLDAHERLDLSGSERGPEAQPACPGQQAKCGGVCVDLQSSQANCGLCGYDCSPLPCVGGQCHACPANKTACGGQCVDTSIDPANCGDCGQVCATGACRFGSCKQNGAGHIVVIGHDFQTSNVAMNRILGNSIFLPGAGDVSVVEYVGAAGTTAVSNSHVAITQVSNTLNRNANILSDDAVSTSDLLAQLRSADVFLVQSQAVATNTFLVQLGQSWASLLGTFVHTGGIIVVLDGSYPVNNGTSQILTGAGLMTVSSVSTVNNQTCSIKTATDPVAASVPATYSCLQNSVVFSGDGTHVVEELGRPVVLHVAF